MGTLSFRRTIGGAIVGILSLVLTGCPGGSSNKLDGVYHAAGGAPMTITIKDNKATVQIANESRTLDYKVEGKKLTILNPREGDIVYTINDDGTLTGELGLMSRKQ